MYIACKMWELVVQAVLGFILGIFACMIMVNPIREFRVEHEQKIAVCEKDLPRSAKCVLIAVPEEMDDE